MTATIMRIWSPRLFQGGVELGWILALSIEFSLSSILPSVYCSFAFWRCGMLGNPFCVCLQPCWPFCSHPPIVLFISASPRLCPLPCETSSTSLFWYVVLVCEPYLVFLHMY